MPRWRLIWVSREERAGVSRASRSEPGAHSKASLGADEGQVLRLCAWMIPSGGSPGHCNEATPGVVWGSSLRSVGFLYDLIASRLHNVSLPSARSAALPLCSPASVHQNTGPVWPISHHIQYYRWDWKLLRYTVYSTYLSIYIYIMYMQHQEPRRAALMTSLTGAIIFEL